MIIKSFTLFGKTIDIYSFRCLVAYWILFVFTVVLQVFVNQKNQYIPAVATMYVSSILFFVNISVSRFKKKDFWLLASWLLMFSAFVFHRSTFRISTIGYSLLFILTFFYFERILFSASISRKRYLQIISFVIKSYAVVLLVQQVSSFIGLPVFNLSYGNVIEEFPLKQGSLSMEPSNSGPILTALYYSYVLIREGTRGQKMKIATLFQYDRLLFLSYVYVCVGSISVSSLVSCLFFFAYFIKPKDLWKYCLVLILFVILLFTFSSSFFLRISRLLQTMITFDPIQIYEIDPSSAARISPILMYFKEINLADINFWVGHGCDYGGLHVYSLLAGIDLEQNLGVGGMIELPYNYGLFSFFAFIVFLIKTLRRKIFSILLYFGVFFIFPINHYVTWVFLMSMVAADALSTKRNDYQWLHSQ